jgi:hypothetical protein
MGAKTATFPSAESHPRRCSAKSKKNDGGRCRNFAMMGQKVCRFHGGSAPKAIAAARLRLLELADPAIKNLHDKMKESEDDRVSLAASKAILDRAGVGPKGSLELEGGLDLEVNDRLSGKDLPLPVRRLLLALADGWKMPKKLGLVIEKYLPPFELKEEG